MGTELDYVSEALELGQLSGNGELTRRCSALLQERCGSERVLLTHSCTGALEMAALLAGVGPGDEVVMPSFTFPSTANAFVLRGATPVFAEIREDTLNLDPDRLEAAIGPRTRAIVPVHYSGVACDMDPIAEIAGNAGAMVIEDAAQGILASYRGRALGSIGSLGAFSFHETKTLSSGEGGALLVNDPDLVDRAEILLEKGTDRARFFRGEVDKYSWVDVGSSFLMSEITAAFLYAQLEVADEIIGRRARQLGALPRRLRRLGGGRDWCAGPWSPTTARTTARPTGSCCPRARFETISWRRSVTPEYLRSFTTCRCTNQRLAVDGADPAEACG